MDALSVCECECMEETCVTTLASADQTPKLQLCFMKQLRAGAEGYQGFQGFQKEALGESLHQIMATSLFDIHTTSFLFYVLNRRAPNFAL